MAQKFFGLLQEKAEGECTPRGFAPCYPIWNTRTIMCAPLGLHLLIRWVRAGYWWLGSVGWLQYVEWEKQYHYHRGYVHGWNDATEKHRRKL
jgi:hypothetical protein